MSNPLMRRSQREILRRDMLRTALAVGGGWSWAARAAAAAPQASGALRYIDTHVHVWTSDLKNYPMASGYDSSSRRQSSFTPIELFTHTRPNDVDRIVLIQISFYGFDNSYMLAAMKRFPNVFSGVARVDEAASRPQDEMRRLAAEGVKGFRIGLGSRSLDAWANSAGMRAMWQYAGEAGLAICPLINPEALPAVDMMCGRYPDTKVVIDHLARIGGDGRIRNEDVDSLARLARHKNLYVKVSAFYALGMKRPPYLDLGPVIRRLVEAYGVERLMWGSDSPYQVMGGHTYKDSIDVVRHRLYFLKEKDKEWLLRKTAEKVFF